MKKSETASPVHEKKNRTTPYCYWIAFAACLGGFIQSYVICVIAGALLFIANEFHLKNFQQGNVASIILIGAITGSLVSGYLADKVGRRMTFFLAAAIFFLTASWSLYLSSFTSLMILRFIKGIAAGITAMLVPLYLAEIAPPGKRGAFVSGYQLSLTIGILAAYLINLFFTTREDWRMMFFIAAIPAAVLLYALFHFPESPKWLLSRGYTQRAKAVLLRLKGEQFSESELMTMTSDQVVKERLFSTPFWGLITIAVILSSFQQFSGINAVIYFTPKIFDESIFKNTKDSILATLLVGIVNAISTLIAIFLVDRIGRRKLLLISQTGVTASLFFLVFAFATQSRFLDVLSVGALIIYVFLYSLGLGPVIWVLISELFPLSVRAKALALATFTSWLSNYLVILFFPDLDAFLGTPWMFFIFAILSLGALLFFFRYIPETKGKTLEELERNFRQKL